MKIDEETIYKNILNIIRNNIPENGEISLRIVIDEYRKQYPYDNVTTKKISEVLNTIYKNYQRHFSDTKNTVCNVLENLANQYQEAEFSIALTGSGAMSAAKFLDLPFIQEVVSCKRAVEKYIPQTDVVIELGGEDAKIIYFDK